MPKGYVWLKLAEVTARANEKDKSWVDTAYKQLEEMEQGSIEENTELVLRPVALWSRALNPT